MYGSCPQSLRDPIFWKKMLGTEKNRYKHPLNLTMDSNFVLVALAEALRQRLTAKVSTDEAVDGGREGFEPGSWGLQNRVELLDDRGFHARPYTKQFCWAADSSAGV